MGCLICRAPVIGGGQAIIQRPVRYCRLLPHNYELKYRRMPCFIGKNYYFVKAKSSPAADYENRVDKLLKYYNKA